MFAHHQPWVPTYPAAPAPSPPPPAPSPAPAPPLPAAITFSATAVATLGGTVGTPIGSTTLATITCADAAMTIILSEAVPGLAFSYAAGVLSVSGTPTAPGQAYRVVASYIASDGSYSVRGSTTHTITIINPADVLTIGAMASVTVQIGVSTTQVLASPTANFSDDITASVTAGGLFGLTVSLAWARSMSTSSGVLTISGSPTPFYVTGGSYPVVSTITVTYRRGVLVVGTSTHSIMEVPTYMLPPTPPAPTPAPAPAPVTSPPTPSPTPSPGAGPDASYSNVLVQMHFPSYDLGLDEKANDFTLRSITSGAGITSAAAKFAGMGSSIQSSGLILGLDGLSITAECMVKIDQACWDLLAASGTDVRFSPVLSALTLTGGLVWTIGFASWGDNFGGGSFVRQIRAVAYFPLRGGGSSVSSSAATLAYLPRPANFQHLCLVRAAGSGSDFMHGAWWDGQPGANGNSAALASRISGVSVLRIGGSVPTVEYLDGYSRDTTVVPFSGLTDEARITAAVRYSASLSAPNTQSGIALASRVIPWPNY